MRLTNLKRLGVLAALLCIGFGATALSQETRAPVRDRARPAGKAKAAERPKTPTIEITLDTSQAPEMKPWAEEAKARCEKNYAMILEHLATPGFDPPKKVKIVFQQMQGVAHTAGSTITCASAFFKAHPDDYGAVIHELCHVVQAYGDKPVPGWVTEGIADYVRWFNYEPKQRHPRVNPQRAKYTDSYQTTAAFFDWIVRTKDKTFIHRLNVACRKGEYKPELFQQYAGKPVDELWAEFVASLQRPSEAAQGGGWVEISEKVVEGLIGEGKKIGYPGKTAGIAVDRVSGDVFMIVPDQGIWKSSDRGGSFARVDGGKIGGRCETGFSLNFDPNGKRLACFMLDGPSAYTLDGGKTWEGMKGNGRGWDACSVDWSAKTPRHIFALRHECGGEIHTSDDMGKSWNLKGKAFASVGIFDPKTFVATKEKEKGIFRSTDGGENWQQVSDLQPGGRDICILQGVAYWTSGEGLLVSRDKGKTWAVQGSAVECSYGPYFGKDEKHIVVVGKKGFFETKDGGRQWEQVAPLPPQFSVGLPGWFLNFGWDPSANVFYASTMGKPAYKYPR